MQYGDVSDYDGILATVADVPKPLTDPVTNSPKDIEEYWNVD